MVRCQNKMYSGVYVFGNIEEAVTKIYNNILLRENMKI